MKRKNSMKAILVMVLLVTASTLTIFAKQNMDEKSKPEAVTAASSEINLSDSEDEINYESPESYTVDEYEALVNDFSQSRSTLLKSGEMTAGEFDNALSIMTEDLQKLKEDNGKGDFVIYKLVDEKTWVDEDGNNCISGISMVSDYSEAELSIGGDFDENDKNDMKYLEGLVDKGTLTEAQVQELLEDGRVTIN